MDSTEASTRGAGPTRAEVAAMVRRLREVRRRSRDDRELGDSREGLLQVIDAALADLEAGMDSESADMVRQDIDLGLATVEEIFKTRGAHGYALVIASIRASLEGKEEGPDREAQPAPPIRFQPPPSAATRRRRPRPGAEAATAEPTPRRRSRVLLLCCLLLVAAVAVIVTLQLRNAGTEPPAEAAGSQSDLVSAIQALAPPVLPQPWRVRDGVDEYEEDMASFTLEISLAEEAITEGSLNDALRHFAAAAAIDREQPRVAVMGRYLVAALLNEADAARAVGDDGRWAKRVESARALERGLGLATSDGGDPRDVLDAVDADVMSADVLAACLDRPVRLTLKSGELIYGRATGLDGDYLQLDPYAGTRHSAAKLPTRFLVTTIQQIRSY